MYHDYKNFKGLKDWIGLFQNWWEINLWIVQQHQGPWIIQVLN